MTTAQEAVEPRAARDVGIAGAARAFGVMSGGPAVLAGAAGLSILAIARAIRRRHRPSVLAVAALAALVAYLKVVRPWSRRWGATPAEVRASLPGDETVKRPGIEMTRAVTIDAPIDDVWPWLAQIGQDRAGFYSYAWLENLAGCELRNADRVHDEWQHRVPGETILLHPANGIPLARFEPPHTYAFEGWYFHLEPIDARTTRLLARTRVPKGVPSAAYGVFVELPHFIMERKMLLGIKERAERARSAPTR